MRKGGAETVNADKIGMGKDIPKEIFSNFQC